MRVLLYVLALASLVAAIGPARAEWSMNVQLERYRWKERTDPEVKIRGWQPGVGVTWMPDREAGVRWRYRGELYAGAFDYDGATGAGTPVQDTIDYRGIANEVDLLYRAMPDSGLQLLWGLGLDYWERRFTRAGSGLFSGRQQEDWAVLFLRVGVEAGRRARPGWFAAAGVKYPLATRMDAHLTDLGFDRNPELNPGGRLSLYADAGYRLSAPWRLALYYEGYRFSQSPAVVATDASGTAAILQPESRQDEVGLRLEYLFF